MLNRKACILVNEISTLRCHAEAKFSGKYWKWAKEHSFESMLPGDVKAHKDDAAQQSINAHLMLRMCLTLRWTFRHCNYAVACCYYTNVTIVLHCLLAMPSRGLVGPKPRLWAGLGSW